MPIAQEGRRPLAILVIVAVVVGITFDWRLTWFIWALALLLTLFFRQPPRSADASPLAVLSPVDGRVEAITERHDPFLNRPTLCISLRQNRLGPYVMYAPTEGKLQRLQGAERAIALLIRTDEGEELTLGVGRGGPVHYLHCLASTGERLRQGGVCGFAGFGQRMRLFLPKNARVTIEDGARLRAGQTVAHFYRGAPMAE